MLALLTVALFVLAGCHDQPTAAGPAASSGAQHTTTGPAETPGGQDTSEQETPAEEKTPAGGAGDFCRQIADAEAGLKKASANGVNASQADKDQAKQIFSGMVDQAPSDIKPALDTIQTIMFKLVDAKAGPDDISQEDKQELSAASTTFAKWMSSHCAGDH